METFWAALISSLISAGGAIVICVITTTRQAQVAREENKENWKLIEYRLDKIEAKQDKHNSVIERTYALEKDMAVIKEKLQKGDDGK